MQDQQLELIQNFHKLIAPKLIGDDFAKEVVTLQMFTMPKYDEKLHIMLIGEVASGKTVLMDDITKIVPNSSYSSSNITRVGLIEKLIACSNGLLAIDEFDEVPKATRTALLEAMQTGTVSIDKYHIHRQFEAMTNIITACNPMNQVFMTGMPLLSQVKFTLKEMSRFHLIIPFYAIEKEMYPDIAVRMNLPVDDDGRRIKLMENLVEVRGMCPKVRVPDNISAKIGRFVAMLKDISSLKEMISPRLIEGSMSMLKAKARMEMCDEVKMNHYHYVYKILEKVYRK